MSKVQAKLEVRPCGRIIDEVENIIQQALKKNENELKHALIRPISEDYFLIGRMGSGKSYFLWKHLLITERLFKKPYYSEIIFCSTSGNMDKTAETFQDKIKTKITYISEEDLMDYLERHLRRKSKYYSIAKYVLSKFKDEDDEMRRLIEKHSLEELDDIIEYIALKLQKYQMGQYPYHTLLILDDFAGSPLVRKQDSPLVRMLTKTRHYNLTCIIVAQTIRFVSLNIKRLATDIVIFSKFSDEDFLSILNQTPNNVDKKEALEKYKQLTGIHDYFQLNISADQVKFVRNN